MIWAVDELQVGGVGRFWMGSAGGNNMEVGV
jgi:hypothetical protein